MRRLLVRPQRPSNGSPPARCRSRTERAASDATNRTVSPRPSLLDAHARLEHRGSHHRRRDLQRRDVSNSAIEAMRARLDDTMMALRTKERDEAEARRIAAEAQLAALENRVQPHFLFNTLNSIAALVHDDPARAERMTTQLASLLRSSLDQEGSPLVPLGEELHVVRNYLEIERVRFGDRLRYAIEVDQAWSASRVPRLAVQTLVENSVKYAVSPRREGGSITVHAAGRRNRVQIEVRDDGPGFGAAALEEGHGLALLRARLAMLFGDDASLGIASAPGATSVTLDLPHLMARVKPYWRRQD